MGLTDMIIIGVIALIVGGAVAYIIRSKKNGKNCIGCPDSSSCKSGSGGCSGNCGACGGCHKGDK